MKAVMVMFDTLARHMLPPYGCDWPYAPNFTRLSERAATFDRSYVCSMPCMPARRDFHTARPHFLHCPWGQLELFDDSVPQMLQDAGVYTHLSSDHYHYWEDGGATYHGRYNSWEFFRGQEGDPWIGQVANPEIPPHMNARGRRSDWVNRQHLACDSQSSQSQTFAAGLQFMERNQREDNWFLHIECFDPHEPFTVDRTYRDLYPSDYDGPLFDWPGWKAADEPEEHVQEMRRNYAALLSKCDRSLGDVLDAFDRFDLWRDTALFLWTDHGYLLGEHNSWGKNWMPLYEEVSHTPFFVWDPRAPEAAGQRRAALVQPALDLGPTLLRMFGQEPTETMLGCDLAPCVADDRSVREAALFGYFDQHINVTDGRYVYLREPDPAAPGADCYTLAPRLFGGQRIDGYASVLTEAELSPPLRFTKGQPVLRIPEAHAAGFGGARATREWLPAYPDSDLPAGHQLFDLDADPKQSALLRDQAVEDRLVAHMRELMLTCDAPPEQFMRMGLAAPEAR